MPKYGRIHKYGRIVKYGKYILSPGDGGGGLSLGPYVRFRIRSIASNGRKTEFLTTAKERISIPSKANLKTRIRANNGDWCTTQNSSFQGESPKVRIRSISSKGKHSEWVYGDRGILP